MVLHQPTVDQKITTQSNHEGSYSEEVQLVNKKGIPAYKDSLESN